MPTLTIRSLPVACPHGGTQRITPEFLKFGMISRSGRRQIVKVISSRGVSMSRHLIPLVGSVFALTLASGAFAQIRGAPDPTVSKEVEAAQLAAKNAAEFEFL